MANISLSNLSSEILKGFQTYTDGVTEAVNDEVEQRSKELIKAIKAIKARSPVRDKDGGYYKKGWTRKIERIGGTITITAYNKNRGSLVHLLEHGHVIKGGTGRTKAIKHVGPPTEIETALLEQNIKSIIKRGG